MASRRDAMPTAGARGPVVPLTFDAVSGVARADRLTGGGCHGVRLDEERTQGGRGLREMSSGTRRRTDSSPLNGRHHGAITAAENVATGAQAH